jgi:hypothetical protein
MHHVTVTQPSTVAVRLEHVTRIATHGVAVTQPSTVAEHLDFVIRGHVPANAPGRSEGRCEHRDRGGAR